MIFALPIVGKILAGFAASEAGAAASTALKMGQAAAKSGVSAADPADFAQTLDAIDQSAAAKAKHASLFAGKV
jgi:hypothetical protein